VISRRVGTAAAVLGLDIGGANLKAAHAHGPALLQPFELWKNPAGLSNALRQLFRRVPPFDLLAVTMTGESCDCFSTRREGVNAILDAVEIAVPNVPVLIWQVGGRLVDVPAARTSPLDTAAANWLALAHYAGRYLPVGAGLLLDVGSTTSDIVSLFDGKPCPRARSDSERLRIRELVYTGVRRTPVCSLLGNEGTAEVFATSLDVYLVLGNLAEDEADRGTADGRPATRSAACARLARMLCADMESCTEEEVRRLAQHVCDRQQEWLGKALSEVSDRLPEPARAVIIAGSGEFLARQVVRSVPALRHLPIISLAQQSGPAISQAACAYALMVLAREQVDGK
jgi:probable H4MPT-linked C1 transfer pathway protein